MFGSDTPSSRAPCSARPRSFWCSRMRKPGLKVRLIIRSPCTSRMRLAAKPPISAWRTLAGSAPALLANSKRLADRGDVEGDDDLVGDLRRLAVADAADEGDVLAHLLEQRLDLLEDGLRSPPTHDRQRACLGADFAAGDRRIEVVGSRASSILRAKAWWLDRRDRAHVDDDLARPVPAFRPAATPFSPNSTASTSGVSGTIVKIDVGVPRDFGRVGTGLRRRGRRSPPAPCRGCGRRAGGRRRRGGTAMGAPMMPRPMNPSFMMCYPFVVMFRVASTGRSRPGPAASRASSPAPAASRRPSGARRS